MLGMHFMASERCFLVELKRKYAGIVYLYSGSCVKVIFHVRSTTKKVLESSGNGLVIIGFLHSIIQLWIVDSGYVY